MENHEIRGREPRPQLALKILEQRFSDLAKETHYLSQVVAESTSRGNTVDQFDIGYIVSPQALEKLDAIGNVLDLIGTNADAGKLSQPLNADGRFGSHEISRDNPIEEDVSALIEKYTRLAYKAHEAQSRLSLRDNPEDVGSLPIGSIDLENDLARIVNDTGMASLSILRKAGLVAKVKVTHEGKQQIHFQEA